MLASIPQRGGGALSALNHLADLLADADGAGERAYPVAAAEGIDQRIDGQLYRRHRLPERLIDHLARRLFRAVDRKIAVGQRHAVLVRDREADVSEQHLLPVALDKYVDRLNAVDGDDVIQFDNHMDLLPGDL